MTRAELLDAMAEYQRGLTAELCILNQVQVLARLQRTASDTHDATALATIAERRDRLMAGLVDLEQQLRPVRATLARERDAATAFPAFRDLVRLHREAASLVTDILSTDRETARALEEAERARRLAAHVLDTGEATLAAYRRVITPAPGSAGLVDRLG
jgi:prephenate dehydrogenase